MSPNRLLKTGTIAAGLLAAMLCGIALAAPLPQGGKAYTAGTVKHGVSLTLVTSASGTAIEPGSAALGSQFALSGGAVLCRKAKKSHGFHEKPFAIFGFPGATLKLSHGTYGFSATVKAPHTIPLGSTAKPFKLKVKIVGQVASPTSIKGTVKAKGGPCTTKKALKFNATVNSSVPVAPGK